WGGWVAVWVEGRSSEAASADARRRVFVQVGLAKNDCPRGAQLGDHGRVGGRLVVGISSRSTGGGALVHGVVVVLDRDRNTVQRSDEVAGPREVLVLGFGDLQCIGLVWIVVGGIGLRALASDVDGNEG